VALAGPAKLQAGTDATTGEVLKASTTSTKLIVPVACSKWHEQKFLSGKAVLRSSLLRRDGERWFMSAQLEFPVTEIRQTGARLGVDRGIVNPIAVAVVNQAGAVHAVAPPAGAEVGRIIHRADERRRQEQKRRGITSHRHVNAVDNQLHVLANGIVAEAKQHGAQVIVEKLDGFKQTIVTTRAKGSRKGGWRRSLKRAQLGKLELLLDYKLKMAGLPSAREVVAGGTSITCPACAARDPKNRAAQDVFACVTCGFTAHADTVGAVNIARRGVAMAKITKGGKLAPLEQDMVARLRSRDDSGLGPLVARDAACGLVLVRASADAANDGLSHPLTAAVGQKTSIADQNPTIDGYSQSGSAHLQSSEMEETAIHQRLT
jgi:IS605 OrfB family transposase